MRVRACPGLGILSGVRTWDLKSDPQEVRKQTLAVQERMPAGVPSAGPGQRVRRLKEAGAE